MFISDMAVDRRTTVVVLLIIILIAGAYAYSQLPREADPEITIPIINISTVYTGVSPEDIETLLTIPIERKLTGLPGVKEITSSSVEGVSIITIEFETDVNIDVALQKVSDKVDLAKGDLPPDAKDSIVKEVNIAEQPIMFVSLAGTIGLPRLSRLAEDLEDKFEAVQGVLEVEIVGDVEREIQVELDPGRLAAYRITLTELLNLLSLENVNTPAGAMELGSAKYLMRVPGEFQSPEELANLVVKRGEVGIVHLSDIASVTDGFKKLETISRVNKQSSVTLTISKRSGENIIAITDKITALVDQAREDLPQGVELFITMDESIEIRDMVNQLESSILSGLVLVMAVVFIFMGFTNALFVSMAIPLSMLMTFIVFMLWGITLNMVVLFSLTLSLGMLVDNAIVVVENIYRHNQWGETPRRAAKKGAGEVAIPIIASTITTIAAFSPLFFWPGIMGSFMVFLPKTATIILTASLFAGLVVNPALASLFSKKSSRESSSKAHRKSSIIRYYLGLLNFALRWRAATITAVLTFFVVVTLVFFRGAEIEFMPETEPRRSDINIELAEGSSLESTNAIVKYVEEMTFPHRWDIDYVVSSVGSGGSGRRGGSSAGSHLGRVTLRFPDYTKAMYTGTEVLEKMRPMLKDVVGAEISYWKQQHGPNSGPPVNIELSGEDFKTLASLAEEIRWMIKDVPGLVDLTDDFDRGKPEIRVKVDREQALLSGLSTKLVGLTVKVAVDGQIAGQYREGDEEYDVLVRFPVAYREDISNVEDMALINQSGRAIPFSTVAEVEQGTGLGNIRHIDRRRTVTISGESEGRRGPEVLADVLAILTDFDLPPGYAFSYTGENEDRSDTQGFLLIAFAAGLLLILLVLITQFNSIVQPLIIMSSVILSLAGVFFGLWIFGMPFGVFMTGLGCISLAGVVVNNAIVLMDFINQERASGTGKAESIIKAGTMRFRPVMLTAVTTILGLIPMAVGVSFNFREFRWNIGGVSSQFWGSMAVAIIFGLAFATILTLVVIPVLVSLADSYGFGKRVKRRATS